MDYIPESSFLENYKDYYLVYIIEETIDYGGECGLNTKLSKTVQNQVSGNQSLVEALNYLGQSDEVMEICFSEEGVWIKLIGPYFKEKVMVTVGYIYNGKEEAYTKNCLQEMWLDENWLLYVPYSLPENKYWGYL